MSKAGRAGYCISVGYSRFDPANSGQKCGRNNQRKGDCKAEDRSLYLWLFGSVEVVHNKTLPTPKVTRHKFGGSVYPLVPVGPLKSSTDSWEQPPGGSMARSAAFPVFTEFLHERDLLCLVASRSLKR